MDKKHTEKKSGEEARIRDLAKLPTKQRFRVNFHSTHEIKYLGDVLKEETCPIK